MRPWLVIFFALAARADISAPAGDGTFRCQLADSRYLSLRPSPVPAAARDLQLRQVTAHHALYTQPTWAVDSVKPRALVIDLPSGHTRVHLAEFVDGFVEDARGELVALLGVEDKQLTLFALDGKLRWRRKRTLLADSAAAIADGGHLYLALFHRIASGSQLVSLSLADGGGEWFADVQQLNVAHSKYFNDVELALDGNILTMIGREAGGCYQQRFSTSDGKRLSSRIVK